MRVGAESDSVQRRSPANATLLSLVSAQVVTALGALIVNVMAARGLGPAGRGEVAMILQLSYIIGAAASLGRDVAFPASVDNEPPRARRIFASIAVPTALGTVIGAVTGAWVPTSASAAISGAALAALVAGNLSTRALRTYAICARTGIAFVTAAVLSQVATIGGGGALMLFGNMNSSAWLTLYGAAVLLPPVMFLIAIRAREPRLVEQEQRRHGLTAKTLGLRLLPAVVFDFVASRLDRLILPLLSGYAQFGIYVVVATMTELTVWPVRQYVDSSVPKWKALHDRNTLHINSIVARGLLFLAAASIVVGTATYALVVPLFGAEFRPARQLVAPLTVAVFAHGVVVVVLGLATATARTGLAATVAGSGFAVSALLYLVLIPGHGAMGAAIGSAAGYLFASAAAIIGLLIDKRGGGPRADPVVRKEYC